jgi:hypothetical protein
MCQSVKKNIVLHVKIVSAKYMNVFEVLHKNDFSVPRYPKLPFEI